MNPASLLIGGFQEAEVLKDSSAIFEDLGHCSVLLPGRRKPQSLWVCMRVGKYLAFGTGSVKEFVFSALPSLV